MDADTRAIIQATGASLVRHAMTAAAGWLVAQGVLTPGLQTNFVDVGVGLAMGVTALVWTYAQKHWMVKTIALVKTQTNK